MKEHRKLLQPISVSQTIKFSGHRNAHVRIFKNSSVMYVTFRRGINQSSSVMYHLTKKP